MPITPTYTNVFTDSNIYTTNVSYSPITLDADINLVWPLERQTDQTYVASNIIDVDAEAGHTITMPNAKLVGNGQSILFNNVGSNTFSVLDFDGSPIISPASGIAWQVYLTDNSTDAGVWETTQFGAATSSADAAALAGYGLKAIATTLNQKESVSAKTISYAILSSDRASLINWTAAGVGIITMPDPAVVGDDFFVDIRNSGSSAITISRTAGLINGLTSLTFNAGDSARFISDGVGFITVGYGQNSQFLFDYTTVNLAGQTTYTLSGAELNRIAYSFYGLLAADCTVTVPATVQQYWVTNNTTGGFTVKFKVLGSVATPISVGPVAAAILYSNGTDMVYADTFRASFPIAIADGGTGATTAAGARTNLGGTATGVAVFTAASAAAARASLGSTATGDAVFIAATQQAGVDAFGITEVDGGTY